MIERSLDLYRQRVANSTLDHWPAMWAVHYAGSQKRGEMFIDEVSAQNAYWVLAPFRFAVEITDAVLIYESTRGVWPTTPLTGQPHLEIIWLSTDAGPKTYKVGYEILSGGVRIYDDIIPSSPYVAGMAETLLALIEGKNNAAFNFDESVASVIQVLKT